MNEDLPWDRWHSFLDADFPNPGSKDRVQAVYRFDLLKNFPDAPGEAAWEGEWPGAIPNVPESAWLRWRHLDQETAARWQTSRVATEASYQERQGQGDFQVPDWLLKEEEGT